MAMLSAPRNVTLGLVGRRDAAPLDEVVDQVRADPVQYVGHRASRDSFAPVRAVEHHDLLGVQRQLQRAARGRSGVRGHPGDEFAVGATGLRGPLREQRRLRTGPSTPEYTYLSAPSDSTTSTTTSDFNAPIRA